jgi:hypothetical protein
MATCNYCGSRILFGGVKEGSNIFCNKTCQERKHIVENPTGLPDNALDAHIKTEDLKQRDIRLRRLLWGAGSVIGLVLVAQGSSEGQAVGAVGWILGTALGGALGFLIAEVIIKTLRAPKQPH